MRPVDAPNARATQPHLRLSVTDTGAGMDEAVRARLFEPFFTTKRLGTGAGLGLAIIKGLVEQAGGFVDVSTAPSRGTTMTLSHSADEQTARLTASATRQSAARR